MLIVDSRFQWGSPTPDITWRDGEIGPGWIPIDIGRREPVIRWMNVGTATLHEPFFRDSVVRLRVVQAAPELESPLATLALATRHRPPVTPSGIIVHMTRCGSTLLVNALKSAENVVGLGEADSLDSLLSIAGSRSANWAGKSAELLRALASVFALYHGGEARNLIIKCGVWGVFGLRFLRKIWPDVPCVVVIREPTEVLVSNWLTPPVWARDSYFKPGNCPAGALPAEVAALGAISPCAWAIGRICTEALNAEDDRCRIVDYRNLTPSTVSNIAEYFGLQFSTDGDHRFAAAFRLDAKRPGREFKRDEQTKQEAANDLIRDAAARWIDPPYQELRSRAYQPWLSES